MNRLFANAARASIRGTRLLPPFKTKKNPVYAFILGLGLGFLGVGIYLSWLDALIVLTVFLVGTFASVGIGAPAFWLFFGIYSAARAVHSNRAIDAASNRQEEDKAFVAARNSSAPAMPRADSAPALEPEMPALDGARRNVAVVRR